jgi:hypothetical protein
LKINTYATESPYSLNGISKIYYKYSRRRGQVNALNRSVIMMAVFCAFLHLFSIATGVNEL